MEPFILSAFADEFDQIFSTQLAALKERSIPQIELRGVDGASIADIDSQRARQLKSELDAAGIGVSAVGSPVGKVRLSDPFEPHFELFKRMLELAHIVGAARIRLFSFYGCPDKAAARDEVLARLMRMAGAARGSGVLLCHENEKDLYGDTAEACVDICRSVPDVKAVFDPANFVQCGVDPWDAWIQLAPYVEYMHVKDCARTGEVLPCGQGDGRLVKILRAYRAGGGRLLSLEPHLFDFAGLSGLQSHPLTRAVAYATPADAFDAALVALRECIKIIDNE